MNIQDVMIYGRRQFFAISTRPGGAGPFMVRESGSGVPVSVGAVRHVRDAALFDASAADAILRAHPRYSVLQAVQVGTDAAAND